MTKNIGLLGAWSRISGPTRGGGAEADDEPAARVPHITVPPFRMGATLLGSTNAFSSRDRSLSEGPTVVAVLSAPNPASCEDPVGSSKLIAKPCLDGVDRLLKSLQPSSYRLRVMIGVMAVVVSELAAPAGMEELGSLKHSFITPLTHQRFPPGGLAHRGVRHLPGGVSALLRMGPRGPRKKLDPLGNFCSPIVGKLN